MNRLRIHFCLAVLLPAALIFSCATGISVEDAAELYYNLGNAYDDLERDSDALKAYKAARRLDPGLFQAGYNLARLHIDAGRFEEGLLLLDELLKKDPENVILLEAYAWGLYKDKRDEDALSVYDRILTLQYNHSRALYNSYKILINQDKKQQAAELLTILWEKGTSGTGIPDKNELLLELSELQLDLGSEDQALQALLFLDSEKPSTHTSLLLGDFYYNRENYDLALETYEKALENDSGSAVLLFKKAKVLLLVVEDEKAGLEALSGALDAGFSDQDSLFELIESKDFLFVDEVQSLYNEKNVIFEDPVGESSSNEPPSGEEVRPLKFEDPALEDGSGPDGSSGM